MTDNALSVDEHFMDEDAPGISSSIWVPGFLGHPSY